MGPEEIHIYFCEGASHPPKGNVIDPKTWKFLKSIFKFAIYLVC